MLKIYNTLTRKKEEFKPLKQNEVKVYHCGPTVYNYAHIGNLKTYTGNDIITRILRFLGYNVIVTMNITDIDDKTIKRSLELGEDLLEFTKRFTKNFEEDIQKLNIVKPNNITPISECIPEMVRLINTMLKRGFAYIADDSSIYFKVSKFKKYGQLANLDMKGMKESVRIDNDEYEKDQASDFALWKAWDKEKDGDNFWEGDFETHPQPLPGREGSKKNIIIIKGRPGWHIECSACAMKNFGPQIDLHMGGIDNLFPHHQNEVAQTESCTRKEFSKYWYHHGHLMVDGKKMAKSANNFYTIKNLEEKFNDTNRSVLYRAIRLSFINGKLRDSVEFNFKKLESLFNIIKSIDETIKLVNREIKNPNINNPNPLSGAYNESFRDFMQETITLYIEALEDDFNIPEALAIFYKFQKFVNSNAKSLSKIELNSVLDMFKTFNEVLAIIEFENDNEEIPEDIIKSVEYRDMLKQEKDFELADKVRKEVEDKGYKIIDDRDGSRVEKF